MADVIRRLTADGAPARYRTAALALAIERLPDDHLTPEEAYVRWIVLTHDDHDHVDLEAIVNSILAIA
jgi:hypothetical protein